MFDLAPKIKSQVKRVGKGFLIFLGVCLVAWVAVINPYLKIQEKKRFEAASAKIQIIAEQMQTKIGNANEASEDNSCSRPNLKTGQGPLSCHTALVLSYEADYSLANSLLSNVMKMHDGALRTGPLTDQTSFVYTVNTERPQIIYQKINVTEGLSCVISYSFYPKIDNITGQMKISVGCSGPARDEHYSVRI